MSEAFYLSVWLHSLIVPPLKLDRPPRVLVSLSMHITATGGMSSFRSRLVHSL